MSLAAAKAAAACQFACDEASGDLVDSIAAANLNDNNTVGSGTGKFDGARDYEASNTEYHGGSSSGPAIQRADGSFSGWAWVNLESDVAHGTVMSCYGGSGWTVDYFAGSDTWRFYHDGNGASTTSVTVSEAVTTGTWKLVMWSHDHTNDLLKLSIDGAAFTTQATGSGNGNSFTGTDSQVGAFFGGDLWDGLIDDCGVLHDYVWTDQDASDLWNSGAGVAFADWAGAAAAEPPWWARVGPMMGALSMQGQAYGGGSA